MSMATALDTDDATAQVRALAEAARAASHTLALAETGAKNDALTAAANAIRGAEPALLEANAKDVAFGQEKNLSAAMIDRLKLDPARIEAMAAGLESVAALPDPVGEVMAAWERPNGLRIERVRVPLGVIGVIYESRPNVTADAGGLCLKSGNAAILRGGSESIHSSGVITECLQRGLEDAGLPRACIQMVPTRDRAAVGAMLARPDLIDVIVPRGGKSLIERVMNEARMPVFAHLEGLCHVYVDGAADPEMARAIAFNAKMRRTGICGAAETLLVDRRADPAILQAIISDLAEEGCELRGDEDVRKLDGRVKDATEDDWYTEYLDTILSVRLVDGVEAAIDHINHYGSHHTDSIVTEDADAARRFLAEVDSAIVMHNTSTQFADGGEFGMGAEIGISTGRMHARGPVGTEQLTSFKYVVRGEGQIRP